MSPLESGFLVVLALAALAAPVLLALVVRQSDSAAADSAAAAAEQLRQVLVQRDSELRSSILRAVETRIQQPPSGDLNVVATDLVKDRELLQRALDGLWEYRCDAEAGVFENNEVAYGGTMHLQTKWEWPSLNLYGDGQRLWVVRNSEDGLQASVEHNSWKITEWINGRQRFFIRFETSDGALQSIKCEYMTTQDGLYLTPGTIINRRSDGKMGKATIKFFKLDSRRQFRYAPPGIHVTIPDSAMG